MHLVVTGLSHKTAPVELREAVAFSPEEVGRILVQPGALPAGSERFLLSTCNRTELYLSTQDVSLGRLCLGDLVRGERGVDLDSHAGAVYVLEGRDAVHHLLRVACSLDSMVVGERQIKRQIREAADLAHRVDATGPVLHRLLEAAFRAGKRARAETRISSGAASVASSAITLTWQLFSDLKQRTVLLVGSGETGKLAARHLKVHKVGRLIVTSRTASHAEALAAELEAETLPFERLEEGISEACVVLTATSSKEPVIGAEMVRRALPARGERPLLFVDIAVPRDVDPAVGDLPGVSLHDIDDLQEMVERNLEGRRAEVPKVERIVEEETDRFWGWYESLRVKEVIRDLRDRFERIRAREVDRHGGEYCDEDREKLESLTRSLVNKFLHDPTYRIRQFNGRDPRSVRRMDTVRRLFGLDSGPEEAGGPPDDDPWGPFEEEGDEGIDG